MEENPETHACEYPGCELEGYACWLPEAQAYTEIDGQRFPLPDEWLCEEHRPLHGYCAICGDFWGGVESFEISGHCDACQAELDYENARDYGDEPDDELEWDDMPHIQPPIIRQWDLLR